MAFDVRIFTGDNALRWLASLVLGVVFTAWHVWVSLKVGTLAQPIGYDDIVYFIEGARRLHVLQSEGVVPFFKGYIAAPMHSPITIMTAMLGYSIGGITPWAAPAANGIALIAFIRMFYAAAKDVWFPVATGVVIILLLSPIVGVAILEFRPDPWAALFTAAGCYWLVSRYGENRTFVWCGVLCGLALLSKPSIFFVTLLVFGVAFLAATYDLLLAKQWRLFFTRLLRFAVPVLLLAGPHYVVAYQIIFNYIYEVIWGTTSNVWALKLPFLESLNYYLAGPGGKFTLGYWVYASGALLLATIAIAWVKGLRYELRVTLSLLVVFAVAWIFVSLASVKSAFIGIVVTAFLLMFLVHGALFMLRQTAWPWATGILLLLVGVGLANYQPHLTSLHRWPFDHELAQARNARVSELAAKLTELFEKKSSVLAVPVFAHHLNGDILVFELQKQGVLGIQSNTEMAYSDDPARYKSASPLNFIIDLSPQSTDLIQHVTTTRNHDAISELLRTDPNLELVAMVPDHIFGGLIRIYKRIK